MSIRMKILLCILLLLTFTSFESKHVGSNFTGKVVKIIDGDTFDVLVKDSTFRIRLNAIDCPERGQDYYQKCKDKLGALCFQKQVRIIEHGKDRNKRIIGDVYLENDSYVNAEMIKEGYAWHFVKYSKSIYLDSLEKEARLNKRGLWTQPDPIAPWIWRANKRMQVKML